MLSNLYKILVVDNEEEQIIKIKEVFNQINLPAIFSTYNPMDPPEKTLTGIRLAFFDIKLHAGDDTRTIQTIYSLINALKSYIDLNNGPYILVFWSTHTDLIDQIKEIIEEREKDSLPRPFMVKSIDKKLASSPEDLKEAIKSELSSDYIDLLFNYEHAVSLAASRSLEQVFNVASEGKDKWGESSHFELNFDKLFSNISFQTFGYDKAKTLPVEGVREGLNPILFNAFNSIELSQGWKGKLRVLLECNKKSDFQYISDLMKGDLNSIYHIDTNLDNLDASDRGVINEINVDKDMALKLFKKDIDQIKSNFLTFDSSKTSKGERKLKRLESKVVLLEISAACDHSQNNQRNLTFILGCLVPNLDKDLLMKQTGSIINDLPILKYQDQTWNMFFDSRFVITFPFGSLLNEFKPLFKIKSELLNKIATSHSNYISRLGIISF